MLKVSFFKASKLHKDIFFNYLGFTINALVTLLLTPFLIAHLGTTEFGLWILLNSFLGYFRLMELGIMPAVIRHVSFYWHQKNLIALEEVIGSALFMLIILSLLALPLLIVVSVWGGQWFQLSPSQQALFQSCFPLVGLVIVLSFIARLFYAIFEGFQEFTLLNICNASASLLSALLTVIVVYSGFAIHALFWVLGIQIIYEGFFKYWVIKKKYPIRISPFRGTAKASHDLWDYSRFAFLTDLSVTISHKIDTLVIALFLPIQTITYYTIATKMSDFLKKCVDPMVSVFFPLASEFQANNNQPALRALLLQGSRMTMILLTPVLVLAIAYGPELIGWWVGEEFVAPVLPIFYIFLGVIYFSIWEATASRFFLGTHKVRFNAAVSFSSALINLFLSFYWVKSIGILGVALATLIPNTLLNAFVALPYACSLLNLTFWRFLVFSLGPHLLLSFLFGAVIYLTQDMFTDPVWAFAFHSILIALVMLLVIFLMRKRFKFSI